MIATHPYVTQDRYPLASRAAISKGWQRSTRATARADAYRLGTGGGATPERQQMPPFELYVMDYGYTHSRANHDM